MKRLSIVFLFFIFIFVGCGQMQETELSAMTGLIVAKEESAILVIENVTEQQLEQLELDEFLNLGYGAIWFKVEDGQVLADLEVGNKVIVEYEIVAESYPGQSEAVSITKLDE
ncbi:DUF3221 domain-containing protein [Alkalihalobacterium elongatum]|uniref:DUF3221 domain-containing protein n=1 Tax=Alkalihalobacterium elongatum TaxID=2675466 RepID=UPI001C1F8CAC|nr:DUF3221 domain-containing protein [Alkalihalobacterium elongatum]